MIRFAIDAMGGDLGSIEVVKACESMIAQYPDIEILLVGKEAELTAHLKKKERIQIIDAPEVMSMEDSVYAMLDKEEASIVKAATLVKDGQADALVTCGSTGAFVAASTFIIKRMKGIKRAALTTVIPTPNDLGFLLVDMGANTDCDAENLVQFALMGDVYARVVRNIKHPRIALLSNGTEDTKGDALRKAAFKEIAQIKSLNFIGNVEGKQVLSETFDVLVTDGFSGNIMFKTMEGTIKGFTQVLKTEIKSSVLSMMGGLLIKSKLSHIKSKFDDKAIGGALLIGLRAPAIKAHGSSDAFAFENAMKLAYRVVEGDVVHKIAEGLNDGN